MTDRDQAELDWWRMTFALRFGPNGLPRVGTALYGTRLELMVNVPGQDELVPWNELA